MGSATAAGLVAGVLIGGIGGRFVMRISALAADSDGVLTESGNVVGNVTFDGTLTLIVFGGGFAGLTGGLLLFAVRPWLPEHVAPRALLFAAVLPLLAGTTLITSDNQDFLILDPAALNVAMFAALFVAFGAAVVLVDAAVSRRIPASSHGDGGPGGALAGAVVLIPMTIPVAMLFLDGGERAPRLVAVFVLLIAAATSLRVVDRRDGALPRGVSRAIAPLGYGSLIGGCVAGAWYTARELDAIL